MKGVPGRDAVGVEGPRPRLGLAFGRMAFSFGLQSTGTGASALVHRRRRRDAVDGRQQPTRAHHPEA